jgi:hypothetical protein
MLNVYFLIYDSLNSLINQRILGRYMMMSGEAMHKARPNILSVIMRGTSFKEISFISSGYL